MYFNICTTAYILHAYYTYYCFCYYYHYIMICRVSLQPPVTIITSLWCLTFTFAVLSNQQKLNQNTDAAAHSLILEGKKPFGRIYLCRIKVCLLFCCSDFSVAFCAS